MLSIKDESASENVAPSTIGSNINKPPFSQASFTPSIKPAASASMADASKPLARRYKTSTEASE